MPINNSVTEFLSWFVKQYNRFYQDKYDTQHAYKLVDKKFREKEKKTYLRIQIAGKGVAPWVAAEEIANNESMLRGFSQIDVRTITYHVMKDSEKDAVAEAKNEGFVYRLVRQCFGSKGPTVDIEVKNTDLIISDEIDKISNDPEIISGLSPEDAHKVGYVAGKSTSQKIK